MRTSLLFLAFAALSVCIHAQTTYSGKFDNIIGPCHGAYNLVSNNTVSYNEPGSDKDMMNTDHDGYFTGSWTSMNKTSFVKDNSFDYANPTESKAIQAYSQGTPYTNVIDPSVGDIFIAKIRETTDYIVIKVISIDSKYNCTGSAVRTGQLAFEYIKFEANVPVVKNIPAQSIEIGATFTPINLNDYVTDETADDDIVWTYSASENVSISIVNQVAVITAKNTSWTGIATVTFTATDTDGFSSDVSTSFEVTDTESPQKTTVPPQTISYGNPRIINLSKYFSDNSGFITFACKPSDKILSNLNGEELTISIADANWTGTSSVLVTAYDASGNSTSAQISITVSDKNAPVVSSIPSQSVKLGTAFSPINLNNYVTDETADEDIIWTFSISENFTVSILNNVAVVSVKNASWVGKSFVTFTATDASGLSSSVAVDFEVTTVVSVSSAQAGAIKLFPNPTKEKFTLEILEKEATVTITDADGRILYRNQQTAHQQTYHIPNLTSGLFYVRIETANSSHTTPLVIQ